MKFSTKLTAIFSVIIFIAGAGISYFVYVSNVRTLEAHIEDRLKNQAFHTMDKIDRMLFERYGDIRTLASDTTISSRKSTPKQITERLLEFKKNYRYYFSLSFFDLNRVRIADTEGKDKGSQHALSEYWPEISGGKDITYSISTSEYLSRIVFHFASVVKDGNGVPFGVVVSRVPIESLYEIVRQGVGIYNVEEDFLIELVDKDGRIIYSNHDKERIILKAISPDYGLISESIKKGTKTGVVKHAHSTGKKGEEILVFASEQGYEDFKGSGWTLITEVPTRVAFASAVEIRNRILVISLLISLFAFAATRLLSSRISKPIERLSAASEEVAKGNLDVKVDITSNDETGRLAEAFNRMTADLKGQRENLEKTVSQRTAELSSANEQLSLILESIPVIVFKLGLEKDYVTIYSKCFETVTGYPIENFTSNPSSWAEHLHPDDAHIFSESRPAFFKKGYFESEHRWRVADGSYKWFSDVMRLVRSPDGKPDHVIGVWKDITERKQAEETLKKRSEDLEERVRERTRDLVSANTELKNIFNAIEQTADAVVITDIDGTIQYINPAFSFITGYSREDTIGQNPRILKSGKNPAEMYTNLWSTILTGNIWKSTTINKKKSGELYYMEMTITPVTDEHGKIRNFVAIQNDVTDRIRAEEEFRQKNIELEAAKDMAEAANRAKSEFLANMSHELRTPLNAIIGFSDILKDEMAGSLTDQQKEFASDIFESGHHLLSIINEILDLSRIEAGKEELETTEFPLSMLFEESLIMFKEKTIKHNIKISTNIADDIGSIKADARKIKQVIINLMSNAIKFTPDGGSVAVQARKIHDAGYTMQNKEKGFNIVHPESGIMHPDRDFIEISVADTGIGIKEEDMQRLFTPFVQLEKHLTKKYAGTGLGLTLCKKFVEMHNGRIWAESEFGQGSRFTFVIPVQQPT